jgi:hypothetical protein
MPKQTDLTPADFRATAELLLEIICEEKAVAAGEHVEGFESNTVRINRLIDERGITGWDRKSLGSLMNRMRAVLRSHGQVGCFPDGREKSGPASSSRGLEDRMQELGVI